jgi:hypothetical protein
MDFSFKEEDYKSFTDGFNQGAKEPQDMIKELIAVIKKKDDQICLLKGIAQAIK